MLNVEKVVIYRSHRPKMKMYFICFTWLQLQEAALGQKDTDNAGLMLPW